MNLIGTILSEGGTPNTNEVHILLDQKIQKYSHVITPIEEGQLILRVYDLQERDPYATADALDLQRRLPRTVKALPGEEVPGRKSIAIAQPIAIVKDDGTVLEPVYVAKPEAPAFLLEDTKLINLVYGLPEKSDDSFPVGTEYFSGAPVRFKVNVLPRHILIVGTTGTGKSWLRGVILEQLHKLGVPQLIFDINREYVDAVKQLEGLILEPGRNLTISLASISIEIFAELVRRVLPTEWQQAIALWAFRLYLEEARTGWERGPERLVQLINEAGQRLSARDDSVAYTRTRVQTWLRSWRALIGSGYDWVDAFKKQRVIAVDCSNLGEWETELVVSSISRLLLNLRTRGLIPPFMLSLDEAHRFIPRGKTTATATILRDLIRRGRHVGISVCIITQYPDSIDTEILRIPNTKFIFAIEPGHLREMRALILDMPTELVNTLPTLPQGVCVLTGAREVIRRSLLLSVLSKRTTTHGGKTPDILSEIAEFYSEEK